MIKRFIYILLSVPLLFAACDVAVEITIPSAHAEELPQPRPACFHMPIVETERELIRKNVEFNCIYDIVRRLHRLNWESQDIPMTRDQKFIMSAPFHFYLEEPV